MRRLAAFSAAFVAAVALFGCGSSAAPRSAFVDQLPPPEEPLVSRAEIGTYGGRFVIAINGGPQTFNPVTATTLYSADIIDRLFTRLAPFRLDTQEEGQGLASSWDVAPDGTSVTFHLRHGAFFSDGQPITAEDVLFSAAVIQDEKIGASDRDLLFMDGEPFAFSAPDPYTVIVKAPHPNGSLLAMLDTVFVLPKHVLQPAVADGTFPAAYGTNTAPDHLVTSGPWRLKQYAPSELVVLTRNPYWFGVNAKGQRLPYLDELVFVIVPDLEAADLKFRSGEVDAMGTGEVRPQNFQWYGEHQQDGDFRLYDLGPQLGPTFLIFNLNDVKDGTHQPAVGPVKGAWFTKAVFRRAVSLAIDREAMIRSVLFGEGATYWSFSTPSDKKWALPDVTHFDYDPTEARRLLSSLGLEDRNGDGVREDGQGHSVAFSLMVTANNAMVVGLCNFIRDDLATVGIKVTLAPVEFNTLISHIDGDWQYDTALFGRGVQRPDPSFAASFWMSSGDHPWHRLETSPDSPEERKVDDLVRQIVASTDRAKRLAAWRELHTIANEQAWVIWLPVQNIKVPVRDRFANLHPSPVLGSTISVLWNAEEIFVKPQGRASN